MALKRTDNKDTVIFLWLIPIANAINYYLTYSHINFSWATISSFFIDTAEGFVTWFLFKAIIRGFDRHLPYQRGPGKRILLQLLATIVAGVVATILMTLAVNSLSGRPPVPASFYNKDLLIISIWFLVVNGIYVGLHFYQEWQNSEESRKMESVVRTRGFKVSANKKELLFDFASIAGFYIEGDYSMLVTAENGKFLVDSSLDKVEKTIPQEAFFRLNRQYIVHRQYVRGFEKSDNGKILVLLKDQDHLPDRITVSRTRAPRFKSWFDPS